jgi:hypothetical protein
MGSVDDKMTIVVPQIMHDDWEEAIMVKIDVALRMSSSSELTGLMVMISDFVIGFAFRVNRLLTNMTTLRPFVSFLILRSHDHSLVVLHLLDAIVGDSLKLDHEVNHAVFAGELLVEVPRRVKRADECETHGVRHMFCDFIRVVRLKQGALKVSIDHEGTDEHILMILEFHDRAFVRELQQSSSVLNEFVATPHVVIIIVDIHHLLAE